MGIIKKILFIIFLFFVCQTLAQTTGDTLIVKGNMYIQHIVKTTETYNTISKKYKVSIEELKLHNKNSKLYYKQSLFIPIRSTLSERLLFKDKEFNQSFSKNAIKEKGLNNFGKRDSLNIAVLLPFYSSKNDSLLSFLSDSQQAKEDIYKDSYMALQYLEGLIIATDSLSKTGMNINLFVYDTENDSSKVQQIIKDGRLKDIDLIIGPIFTRNLRNVTRIYGKDTKKRLFLLFLEIVVF